MLSVSFPAVCSLAAVPAWSSAWVTPSSSFFSRLCSADVRLVMAAASTAASATFPLGPNSTSMAGPKLGLPFTASSA